MNSCHGRFFGASAFSGQERKQMEVLMSRRDLVLHLPSVITPAI